MAFEVLTSDKQFLLGEYKDAFERLYSSDIVTIPENWNDYFFTKKQVNRQEVGDWKLILKYLLCDKKTLMECFFDSELPRSIQQSCQILLKKSNQSQQFTFKDKPFEKKYFAKLGTYDVISSPFYIRQKFKDIDAILKADFNKKLFFVFAKNTHYPYQISDVAVYHFFIKDQEVEFYSETNDYLIGDINIINDENFFNNFLLNGYRYSSVRRLDEIARSIKSGNYSPETDTYLLGDGAIALLQSMYPKLPLIHFGHNEWDNCTILIVEESENVTYKSNRVNYADYLAHCYLSNINFNNIGYLCNAEEFLKYKIKLIIKFSDEIEQVKLSQNQITDILKQ